MTQNSEQRLGVFVDVQNMYHSAKHLYAANVNFGELLKKAVAGRRLIRAIAYVVRSQTLEEENFFEALTEQGFELRVKDLQVFYGGAKKGDWDVGIAMDIMRLAGKLDAIVLVSGDGDFTELLKHAKALGCQTEVLAFERSASASLKSEADYFFDLGQDQSKFLIKKILQRRLVRRRITRK